jgi:hypothetical protein
LNDHDLFHRRWLRRRLDDDWRALRRRVKCEGKRVELPKGWEERLSSGCCGHYLHLCPDCVAKGDP